MIDIRQIQVSEWQKYRDVRLRALRDAPDAFGSTYAIESAKTDAAWQHQIETALSSHSDYPLFALIQEDVCGLVWCKLSAAEPDTAHIYQMWVDPAVRGSGAGHALLDCAVMWARKKAVHRVCLGVTLAQSPAMRLYQKYGFLPIGQLEPLREGSHLEAQTLELQLQPRPASLIPSQTPS